jgi:hypothetical protein
MAPPNLVDLTISQKMWEMNISKPNMFAPSTPCTIHFECMESGPNDSTRVRRLTRILRRARVKIFILAYGSFWLQLSGFLSNLTGHHETKTAKPIWSRRSKYSNVCFKSRLPNNVFFSCEFCGKIGWDQINRCLRSSPAHRVPPAPVGTDTSLYTVC